MELSEFQKISVEAIKNGYHSLICAPTGSGKTLPAEIAIQYFKEKNKKIIYTSPIKALSNQKFYDLSKKFPNISFGLITGDIKMGPNADCIIMTCEILRNNLIRKNNNKNSENTSVNTSFELNIEDIGLIIFDEVHYVNDYDRGHVWEETFILVKDLPIQLLMLSATLHEPEKFAKKLEILTNRKVILSETHIRVVPLEHYSLQFFKNSLFKNKLLINDILKIEKIQNTDTNADTDSGQSSKHSPYIKILLKDSKLHKNNFINISKINTLLKEKETPGFIINEMAKYLQQRELLPSIFFSLSRKNVMYYASLIQHTLNPDLFNNEVRNECLHIIQKLPNYKEYTSLPEFETIVTYLEKGVAYHHSGLLSVFREMIELMFEKGYVKLLFATETFAVGINLPTKATIFDNLTKYDGSVSRNLHSHEYSQMSGRAGRRGLDKIGYVFHLTNMKSYHDITLEEFSEIFSNKSQIFTSKFHINNELILRILSTQDPVQELLPESPSESLPITSTIDLILNFINNSSLNDEILSEKKSIIDELNECLNELSKEGLNECLNEGLNKDMCDPSLKEYITLNEEYSNCNSLNRQRALLKKINALEVNNPLFKQIYKKIEIETIRKNKINNLKIKIANIDNYILNIITSILSDLIEMGFVKKNIEQYSLTNDGINASKIQEVNGLALSKYIKTIFEDDATDIVSKISQYIENPDSTSDNIDPNFSCQVYVENIQLVKDWIHSTNEQECLEVLNNSGLYIGTFIKMMLKLDNLVKELETCEFEVSFKYKLSQIHSLLQKHIITNQSLYI